MNLRERERLQPSMNDESIFRLQLHKVASGNKRGEFSLQQMIFFYLSKGGQIQLQDGKGTMDSRRKKRTMGDLPHRLDH